MSIQYNTSIVRDGLVLHLDAANVKSYPGSGTVWNDLSGKGNNGTLVNGVGYSTSNNGSLMFDAIDDGVSIQSSIGYTTEVSVFGFIKTTGTPGSGYHILCGPTYLEISIPTAGQIRTGIETSTGRQVSNHGSGLTDGNWHQVGMTFSNNVKKSYIDGNYVGEMTTTGTLINSFANRALGVFGIGSGYTMKGHISNYSVYSRALSDAEIKQNFEALRGRYGI
jgi:Concanavalin A-like lectin/glucanases superfamily